MLTERQIKDLVTQMWTMQQTDRRVLDEVYRAVTGRSGRPNVPEDSAEEIKDLARLSVLNVLGMVRDSFAQNLAVVGYRTASAEDNDPAWETWQRNRMDARQAEVHRPAITYGASYALVTPSKRGAVIHTRSPRQMLAVYEDPTLDAWPQYALQTWVTQKNAKPWRRGVLFDSERMYELDLGAVTDGDVIEGAAEKVPTVSAVDSAEKHRAVFDGDAVCPVVRFINGRDADDMIVGEVAPLMTTQRVINEVNFDRLIVSRFAAIPQKVITGWQGDASETARAGAARVMSFKDHEVRAQNFPAGDMAQYDATLSELFEHVALVAGLSPAQVTGKMVNVSADALAAAEAIMQRKLTAKRDSFGESWEQVMRLCAAMDGDPSTAADSGAEVVWRDTEARTFAAVVDGVTKLHAADVPIEPLLPLIPGLTQQQVTAIKNGMRDARTTSLVQRLTAAPLAPIPAPPANATADVQAL